MKKILPVLKKVALSTCAFFTVMVLFLLMIGLLMPQLGTDIAVTKLLYLLAFSAFLALLNLLFGINGLAKPIAVALHFVFSGVGFYVMFPIVMLQAAQPSSTVILVVAFCIVYWLIMLPTLLLKNK